MDIVGIGRPCVDIISVVHKLPSPNSGIGILDFSRQGGGIVPNAVVAAARLGASAGFIGISGNCLNSIAIREDFKYNSVDISRSIEESGVSDFAIILSDMETKGRSILYRRGDLREVVPDDLDKEYITSADFLHLDHYGEAQKTATVWMREAGKKVSYDASFYTINTKSFLPYIDVFIASEFYYKTAFKNNIDDYKKNCSSISESGPEIVIFTLGERGCIGFSKAEGFFQEDGFKVKVTDTVGAGDVFHGAFIFGLTKGWTVRQCACFANAVSAVKVSFIGGRAGIPSFDTATKFMKTGVLDDTELLERVNYYKNKWLYG